KGVAAGGRVAWRAGVWSGRLGGRAAKAGYKKASGLAKVPARIEPRLAMRPSAAPVVEDDDPPLVLDRPAETETKSLRAEPLVAAKPSTPKKSETRRQSRLALEDAGG